MFYAPLKPPTHPVPSGDRRVARLLMRAIEAYAGVAKDLRRYYSGVLGYLAQGHGLFRCG